MNITRLRPECLKCLADKYLDKYEKSASDEQKLAYMQRTMQLLAEAPKTYAAPVLVKEITDIYTQIFGEPENEYREIKWHFNKVMMHREAELNKKIDEAEDSLKLAIQYSMIGNYIDFGTMLAVDEEYLGKLLAEAAHNPVTDKEYESLKKELEIGKKLVVITDNCGEIVLDKLMIRAIQKLYSHLEITVIVRGGEVLNDATMTDAVQVGMTDVVTVIDNGNDIAGTWMDSVSAEAKEAMDSADVILAKGQANFETLRGCGRNIYYLFLCKCEMFAREFNVPQYTGMLVRERN